MILTPTELGITVPGMDDFRPVQQDAFNHVINSRFRIDGLNLPTGSGKTWVAIAIARNYVLQGINATIVTGTKGLQDPYMELWGVTHDDKIRRSMYGIAAYSPSNPPIAWDVRGRKNYACTDYPDKTCGEGQHLKCSQDVKCVYNANLNELLLTTGGHRRIPVINYAYWLEVHRRALAGDQYWHRPGVLILDEAHIAPDILTNFMTVQFYETEFKMMSKKPFPVSVDPEVWIDYAFSIQKECEEKIKYLKTHISANSVDLLLRATDFVGKMSMLSHLNSQWVISNRMGPRGGSIWEFAPLYVGRYTEKYLFCGAKKVVLLSGTLRQKTLSLLGVNRMTGGFREWPRVFPAYRSPVYHLKTVKLNKNTGDAEMMKIVEQCDKIIRSRADRKGMIHCGSYARQEFIRKHSRYAQYMHWNTRDIEDGDTAPEAVLKFREASCPAVLVTPSCGTGWDFPMEDLEWQIIVKVPYPDVSTEIMQKRMEMDGTYVPYVTGQELLQMCGRGSRSEKDRCETFILDDNIVRLEAHIMPKLNRPGWLVPSWFKIWHIDQVPTLPPSLYDEIQAGKI